jgi:hypothetical protein
VSGKRSRALQFVHRTAVQMEGYRALEQNAVVAFDWRRPKIFLAASRYHFLGGLACPSLRVMRFSPTAN